MDSWGRFVERVTFPFDEAQPCHMVGPDWRILVRDSKAPWVYQHWDDANVRPPGRGRTTPSRWCDLIRRRFGRRCESEVTAPPLSHAHLLACPKRRHPLRGPASPGPLISKRHRSLLSSPTSASARNVNKIHVGSNPFD